MTTAPETAGCGDAHDCSDHDHGPTGADIVRGLVRGLSVAALAIPVLALALILIALPFAPTTPLPLLLGMTLGFLQLLTVLLIGMIARGGRASLAVHPVVLAVRSLIEEGLRLGIALLAIALWPFELPGRLGVWVGLGAALVWMAVALLQTISARRRVARPSDWSREAIATLLSERVGVRSTIVMRLLDVTGSALFQIGATVLVALAPVLVIGTLVLSIASMMSTLLLQRRAPAQRVRSVWAYAPVGIAVMTIALALFGISAL